MNKRRAAASSRLTWHHTKRYNTGWAGTKLSFYREIFVYLFELAVGIVGVDLRCRDACMTEHRLHRADVRAALQEIGRKEMPQLMRRNFFYHARFRGVFLYHPLDRTGSKAQVGLRILLDVVAHEQRLVHVRARAVVRFQRFFRAIGQKHDAQFPPFPSTANSPVARLMFLRLSEHSSDTRNPVENNVSSIARSRNAVMSFPSGAASKRSISACSRKSSSRSRNFPSSIFSGANVFTSRFCKYFKTSAELSDNTSACSLSTACRRFLLCDASANR